MRNPSTGGLIPRRRFRAALLLLALGGLARAQPMARVLSQADIDRFLRDFPALVRELGAAGTNFDAAVAKAQENPRTFTPAALRALLRKAAAAPATRQALDKYQWTDRFWDVYYAVYVGVYVSMMDQALAQYPSPELKAQVDAFRATLAKDDHTLILRNLEALVAAFEAAAGS